MKILSDKLQALKENFNKQENKDEITLRKFIEYESKSEENFYRWLFNAIGDEEFEMTEERKIEYEEFLSCLNDISPDQLINWSNLSRFLTGNRNNIKNTHISKRWREPIEELKEVIEEWQEKHKDKSI